MISVFMMIYNHERYISHAIEGILMQITNFDCETVIREDCSTDRTDIIFRELSIKEPEKIKLYTNDRNIGVIPNFIKAINLCKGEFLK